MQSSIPAYGGQHGSSHKDVYFDKIVQWKYRRTGLPRINNTNEGVLCCGKSLRSDVSDSRWGMDSAFSQTSAMPLLDSLSHAFVGCPGLKFPSFSKRKGEVPEGRMQGGTPSVTKADTSFTWGTCGEKMPKRKKGGVGKETRGENRDRAENLCPELESASLSKGWSLFHLRKYFAHFSG